MESRIYFIGIDELLNERLIAIANEIGLKKTLNTENFIIPGHSVLPSNDKKKATVNDKPHVNKEKSIATKDLIYILNQLDWGVANSLNYDESSLLKKYSL